MIIDFHTHMREGQGEASTFITAMDENGIDMAGVSNILRSALQSIDEVNKFVLDAVQRYPNRLIGYVCVYPQQPGAAKILERYVHEYGMKALKINPPMQDFSPDDPSIFPVIEKAIELDIPILIHTGPIFVDRARLKHCDPLLVDELAMALPDAKIVIAHGDPLGYGPAIVGKNRNVYMDTTIAFARLSRLIPGLAEETLGWMATGIDEGRDPLGGADKLLFGSDANPLKTWRFKYGLEPLQKMEIPAETKAKILGGNAAKLLKVGTVSGTLTSSKRAFS